MPSIVPDHSSNTTHLAYMGVLDYSAHVYELSTEGATYRHLIIPVTSIQTNFMEQVITQYKCNEILKLAQPLRQSATQPIGGQIQVSQTS